MMPSVVFVVVSVSAVVASEARFSPISAGLVGNHTSLVALAFATNEVPLAAHFSFSGTLATKFVLLPSNDPESKGLVERRNGYFETSFMPGRAFSSPADFNDQFGDWLVRANQRIVRTIKARPIDLVDADRAKMLPPVPLHLGWRERVRLGRDYYVRLDTRDYSVDPTAIGRMVDVSADLDRVRARLDGKLVADHARVWARGAAITDQVHRETARSAGARSRTPSARRRRSRTSGRSGPRGRPRAWGRLERMHDDMALVGIGAKITP
jgi:hypothetical protein